MTIMAAVSSVTHPRRLEKIEKHFNEVDLTFYIPEVPLEARLIVSKKSESYKDALALIEGGWYFVAGSNDQYVFERATRADLETLANAGLLTL